MLKIVHISLNDSCRATEGQARLLMEGQTAAGHMATLFAHMKSSNDPRIIALPHLPTPWQQKLLDRQKEQKLFHLYSAALLPVLNHPRFAEADVVHLHSVGPYFSYLLMPFLTAKPTVWTFYDGQPFSSGCRHTAHCQNWRENHCQNCPLDRGQEPQLQRAFMLDLREKIYQVADFTVVCPNEWLKAQTEQSIVKGHPVRLIRAGVDREVFCPGDQAMARQALGLPLDQKIIFFSAPGGLDNPLTGGPLLLQALQLLAARHQDLFLVSVGSTGPAAALPGVARRDLPGSLAPDLMATYYRAADVFAFPSLVEGCGVPAMESLACGTPVAAFRIGPLAEVIREEQDGSLVPFSDIPAYAEALERAINGRKTVATRAMSHDVGERFDGRRMVSDYLSLYEELAPGAVVAGNVNDAAAPVAIHPNDESIASVTEKMGIAKRFSAAHRNSWDQVWLDLEKGIRAYPDDREKERGIFVDAFLTHVLEHIDVTRESTALWKTISLWLQHRKMPARCGYLSSTETLINLWFSRTVRDRLKEYFSCTALSEFRKVDPVVQTILINFNRIIFLNGFSVLNLQTAKEAIPAEVLLQGENQNSYLYPYLLTRGMYESCADGEVDVDLEKLYQSDLPIAAKVIVTFWLCNMPYYNTDETHLQVSSRHIEEFCRIGQRHPEYINKGFFFGSVEHLTPNLWRASYIGGNLLPTLSAYGDYLHTHMKRQCPAFAAGVRSKTKKGKNKKIRIGYISSNFCFQAVAFYMINRFLHHDRDKFDIVTFLLEKRMDEITDLIKDNSDEFIIFKEFNDIDAIAGKIVEQDLDILIYADIGMDQVTYKLGALQLAPVQCVLVGHGVTTGLPTIQYYIGGDFEPVDADTHYREKLIRLPNLGAAQYPPPEPKNALSRQEFGISEDKVVFISCANGIKHGPERDHLLVEILCQAPNAVIVLKPFMNPQLVDQQLIDRWRQVAEVAGVADRLLILPPLRMPNDLIALLRLCDVQLDTYPYGGWTTNMEAVYSGLPLVTQEGDMARSRWGAAMLRALGVEEGIARNEIEYVDWAVRLATDDSLRLDIKSRIQNSVVDVLFNGKKAQSDYEECLINIYNQQVTRQSSKNRRS